MTYTVPANASFNTANSTTAVICISFFTVTWFEVFLPRDASAERGDATVSRPSVTFRYQQHIGWNSWKIISRPNSLRPLLWLTPNMGDLVQREHPQN